MPLGAGWISRNQQEGKGIPLQGEHLGHVFLATANTWQWDPGQLAPQVNSPEASPLQAQEMHCPPDGPFKARTPDPKQGCAKGHRMLGLNPLPFRVPFVAPTESLQMAEERSQAPCP